MTQSSREHGPPAAWLIRRRTSRLFLASSVVVLAAGCLILALNPSNPAVFRVVNSRAAFYVPVVAVLGLNAVAATFLMVGGLWYWARFDDSRRLVKLLWLASFLALGWYSMSVYYFAVYRRQLRGRAGAGL